MATILVAKYPKNRVVAKLVTENRQPCVFCQQDVDDEVIYGKLYSLGDIQCHYFCVLLSCCLVQKGKDSEGLFGFLYKDILAEVERSKKHKCSYCGRGGASLGCSVAACRKQFHLPCGRAKNVVSLFFGNYKSFCELHAPKQKISDSVMVKAKERMKRDRLIRAGKIPVSNVEEDKQTESPDHSALVCVICYEPVPAFPSSQTFWPPCCGRDAWLHRACLQRMALSAGMHYLKCPLCNDKETFHEAVSDQGYYLPDRDAAWELEQNAFAEMYARELACGATRCACPYGRAHDDQGIWDIKLCLLCGSWGMHAHCSGGERLVCASCRPAARDIDQLETRLAAVMAAEQAREQRGGPVMPGRMSLRRTKGRLQPHSASSSSQNLPTHDTNQVKTPPQSIKDDRLELNLKPPKRPKLLTPNLKGLETLLSPIKMLEQSYLEKGGGGEVVVTKEVIEKMRLKFSKPKPLSAKKKIVNEILDDLFKNVFKESVKSKDPVMAWNSPKKSLDVSNDTNEEPKDNSNAILNKNTSETEGSEVVVNPKSDVEKVINESAAEQEPNELDVEKSENKDHRDVNVDEPSAEDTSNKINTEVGERDPNDLNNCNANLNICGESTEDNDSKSDDASSTSTFQLPPEFIAESEDELPIFDTPKKLKTVDIKHDSSIEISEHDEIVNIDVVHIGSGKEKEFIKNLTIKSPIKNKMCSFKFSPIDKETLQTVNIDIDVESFKDQYLNEVDRDKNSNHSNNNEYELRDVFNNKINNNKSRKRKLDMKEGVKRKKSKLKIKIKAGDSKKFSEKRAKRMKEMQKRKEELKSKAKRKNKLKIKIKSGDTKKVSEKKAKRMKQVQKRGESKNKIKKSEKQKVKSYKQYILKYSPLQTNKVIAKPEVDVNPIIPIKRKYTKLEKSNDNLVQTSIQSFFKAK